MVMLLKDDSGDEFETMIEGGTFNVYTTSKSAPDYDEDESFLFELTKENAKVLADELAEFLADEQG